MGETFTLPAPISTNALRSVANGRIISSPEYRKWKAEAAQTLRYEQRAHKRTVSPPYALTIRVPRTWGGDISNAIKAAEDALQDAYVISNDKAVEEINIRREGVQFCIEVSQIVQGQPVAVPHMGRVG